MVKKRGVSPVIATVLLIAMVIVIALIVFLWIQELGGESIKKFGNKNIETVCKDVSFSADYSNGEVSITNNAEVPIANFKLKVVEVGSHYTLNMWDIGDWPATGLGQGGSFISNIASSKINSGATKLVLTPVLKGKSSKGESSYMCDEGAYSQEIII